jgi:GH18 family chitinase
MSSSFCRWVTILLALVLGVTTGSRASAAPWVSAYYAGWYWDWTGSNPTVAVAAVDMTTMTHFVFGRYAPGAGTLGGSAGQVIQGAGTGHSQVENALIAKAHTHGVKALFMLGGVGDGGGFVASTASASIRATFITNLLDLSVAKNYDGIDVDWEDSLNTTTQQNQLIAFLGELRTAAASRPRYQPPNAPFIVTFPGFALNLNYETVPAWKVTVASLVDQYNLMTYSQNFAYSGWETWFFGALKGHGSTHPTSIAGSIQRYVDAGVPRGKLGMGIGLYGNYYAPPVTGPRQPISSLGGNDDNYDTWANFYNKGLFNHPNGTYVWDPQAETGYYAYSPAAKYQKASWASVDDVSMLTTEDLQSIAAKGAWARAGNCGGTIVWTINYGYVNSLSTNPPMNTIKEAFLAGGALQISPVAGPTAGGTTVTINGNGFTAGTTVSIGGVPATGVVVSGPTKLTAITGAHPTGLADVTVTIPVIGSTTLPQGFFYAPPPLDVDFYTVAPCRVVDTRASDGPALTSFERRVFTLAGKCGLPATAKALALNVTVVGAGAPGHIRLAPGNGLTETSALNFSKGQTRGNNAIIMLATDGTGGVAATNRSSGTVQLILDVSGYFE